MWLRRAGLVLLVLISTQMVTYFTYASSRIPVAALRHLPEYSLALEQASNYVVIDASSWAGLSEAQRNALTAELNPSVRTIYHAIEDVPKELLVFDRVTTKNWEDLDRWERGKTTTPETLAWIRHEYETGRIVRGFKDGAHISVAPGKCHLFVTVATAVWRIGPLGAQGRTDIYIWVLFGWIQIRSEGGFIS